MMTGIRVCDYFIPPAGTGKRPYFDSNGVCRKMIEFVRNDVNVEYRIGNKRAYRLRDYAGDGTWLSDWLLVLEFMVRRSWLAGNGDDLITGDQYDSLKRRDGKFWRSLTQRQRDYLLGYVDGWNKFVKPLDTLSALC